MGRGPQSWANDPPGRPCRRRERHDPPPRLHRPGALRRRRGRAGPGPGHLPRWHRPSARDAARLRRRQHAAAARARLLPLRARADAHRGACRLAAELRLRLRPRHLRDDADAARPVRALLPGAVRPAAAQPRGHARGGHQRDADPGALQLRRARPCRRQHGRRAPAADARPVRPARSGGDGRRHRQRHARAAPRRAAAAGAVHRTARGLLAAAAAPLHRHRAGALPELHPLHQLPVLHRRVRQARPPDDGRRGQRLRLLRRAGQRHHAPQRHGRVGGATNWAAHRRGCRRCRPTT